MALSDRGGQLVHPTLLRRPLDERTPMPTTLVIISDDAPFIDNGRRRHPSRGDVVEVSDPSVAKTLLAFKKAAIPGEEPPDEEPVTGTGEGEGADDDTDDSGDPGEGAGDAEEPASGGTEADADQAGDTDDGTDDDDGGGDTWETIPGISDSSRPILVEKAQDLDPREATPEQLEEILGSKQRASFVVKALKERFDPDGGEE